MFRATVVLRSDQAITDLGAWEFATIPAFGDTIAIAVGNDTPTLRVSEVEHRPVAVRPPASLGGAKSAGTVIYVIQIKQT